jgi:membrane-associated phospholipid phosphatase
MRAFRQRVVVSAVPIAVSITGAWSTLAQEPPPSAASSGQKGQSESRAGGAAASTTVAPTPSGAGSALPPASGPAIAPPAPGAPPEKVEKAKEVAKVAELTPIVPSPADATRPAFQLYAETDLPLLGLGGVMAAARLTKAQKAYCAPLCDPDVVGLNALDRLTAGYWSVPWQIASDVGLYSLMVGSAVVLVVDEGLLPALNDAVVVAESALSAAAVTSILTLAAGRPRPFLFGKSASLDVRNGGDANLSFASSHAAISFALAMSTFMATRRLHPKSRYPLVVLGAGAAIASFVGTARVLGGEHFITDALGGAVVGTSVGVLIPGLHQSPVKIVPVVSDTQRGFAVAGIF